MRFQPKTEKEIQEANLWPAGIYDFEILPDTKIGANSYSTCDRVSKSGNDMIQLVVKVVNDEGRDRVVIDYLMEQIEYKLRHAAVACGLEDEYESGQLHADQFIGKTGKLKLKIEKDKNGQYADKNAVADYVHDAEKPVYSAHSAAKANGFVEDDLPF